MTPESVRRLLEEIDAKRAAGRSWRSIAKDYPAVVKPGTLCRIAKEQGRYLPDDRKILRALGLIERRKQTEIQKRISRMARDTRKAVIWTKKSQKIG